MNRIKRLKPVQDIAERDEREAAMRLGERLGQVDEARRRLDEMLMWERDYSGRLQQGAVNVNELQSYRLFMHTLGDAIEQQRMHLAEAERSVSQARENWQQSHARHAALSKVVERCRDDERRAVERREQLEQDEFSTLRVFSEH